MIETKTFLAIMAARGPRALITCGQTPGNFNELTYALEPGGLLHRGQWVKARDFRDIHPSWPPLIEAVRKGNPQALATLDLLGVIHHYKGKGWGLEFAAL